MPSLSHANHPNHYPYHPPRTSFTTFVQSLYHRRLAASSTQAHTGLSVSSSPTPPSSTSPPSPPSSPEPSPPASAPLLPSLQRSHSPYSHASPPQPNSHSGRNRNRNEPHCTCHTPSCHLHNGLWDFLKRAGFILYIERVEREEERLNPTGDPEISESLELEDLDLQMPTVEEVLDRVMGDGWNLRSECWRWG